VKILVVIAKGTCLERLRTYSRKPTIAMVVDSIGATGQGLLAFVAAIATYSAMPSHTAIQPYLAIMEWGAGSAILLVLTNLAGILLAGDRSRTTPTLVAAIFNLGLFSMILFPEWPILAFCCPSGILLLIAIGWKLKNRRRVQRIT